jgi:hypothetical protein
MSKLQSTAGLELVIVNHGTSRQREHLRVRQGTLMQRQAERGLSGEMRGWWLCTFCGSPSSFASNAQIWLQPRSPAGTYPVCHREVVIGRSSHQCVLVATYSFIYSFLSQHAHTKAAAAVKKAAKDIVELDEPILEGPTLDEIIGEWKDQKIAAAAAAVAAVTPAVEASSSSGTCELHVA